MRTKLKITEGIFPMPVLMVATYNEDGSVNVMTAAWGTMQERGTVALNLTETHKTVQNGLMGFGEIQGNGVSLLHGAPCGVHHIHAAVLVISRNHQNRHWENTLGDFQFCSHDNFSL